MMWAPHLQEVWSSNIEPQTRTQYCKRILLIYCFSIYASSSLVYCYGQIGHY